MRAHCIKFLGKFASMRKPAKGTAPLSGNATLFSMIAPYLLLVSFSSGHFLDLNPERLDMINASPYHGAAIALVDAYDTNPYTGKDFEGVLKKIQGNSEKHIWPWVFWNRAVGFVPSGPESLFHKGNKAYFAKIGRMDIYNRTGALDDFFELYRSALRGAKRLGSPGIVLDMEAYNIRAADRYDINALAESQGKSVPEVRNRLREIGRELADISESEYPGAKIWFLFSGLGRPVRSLNPFAEKDYNVIGQVALGLLERAKARKMGLELISGGEMSLGYCHRSMLHMEKKIRSRDAKYEQLKSTYPNLSLGGTLAPWIDRGLRHGWGRQGDCGDSEFKGIADFGPPLSHLMGHYEYLWLYAAGAMGYSPYEKNSAKAVNKTLSEAFERTRTGRR